MSTRPDLTEYRIANPDIDRLIRSGATAVEAARRRLGDARKRLAATSDPELAVRVAADLSDLACALNHDGAVPSAAKALQEAVRLAPASVDPFHNLAALLFEHGQMRGKNLESIIAHLNERRDVDEWATEYLPLTWMPVFVNLQFVEGKCNLKCRMCVGTNASKHPNKLSYMTPDAFRRALAAAPTISGVTLSSGDSDPLLHPGLEEIIAIAEEQSVVLDIFTNGLPLGERTCRRIVESQAVGMINFSIDAATAATYERIRGGDFDRLHRNIRMLCRMKEGLGGERPLISLSFVAMADNIEELPAFVEWGREYGAVRVYVEDLLGWMGESGGNYPATDNPRCHDYVCEAKRLARDAGIFLQLSRRLQNMEPREHRKARPARATADASDAADAYDVLEAAPTDEACAPSPAETELRCCSWINGVWVSGNGDLQPCCMIQGAADMGNTADGPLYANEKYNHVKSLLAQGKVFNRCASKTMCAFVQQEKAWDRDLRFIESEELGDLAPSVPRGVRRTDGPDPDADADDRISLPVLASG